MKEPTWVEILSERPLPYSDKFFWKGDVVQVGKGCAMVWIAEGLAKAADPPAPAAAPSPDETLGANVTITLGGAPTSPTLGGSDEESVLETMAAIAATEVSGVVAAVAEIASTEASE